MHTVIMVPVYLPTDMLFVERDIRVKDIVFAKQGHRKHKGQSKPKTVWRTAPIFGQGARKHVVYEGFRQ